MIRLTIFCFLMIIFGACSDSQSESDEGTIPEIQIISDIEDQAQDTPPAQIVSADGFENVRFGMTEAEAISSFNGTLERPEHISDEYKNCYYLETSRVAFMVHYGKIDRIDIWTPEIATKEGARVGMNAKSIEDLYPDIQHKPNFYTFPIQDMIVEIYGDTKIIFEQDGDGVIERFRIGKTPAIEFVEGCL